MHEIYRNTTQFVTMDVYGDTTDAPPTAAIVSHNGDEVVVETELLVNGPEDLPDDPLGQRWVATVPLSETQNIGDIHIRWEFVINGAPGQKDDHFEVVRPYLNLTNMRAEMELGPDVTDEQLVMVERRVRKIIDAYCNQDFSFRNDTITVVGNGTKHLNLPRRIITVDTIHDIRTGSSWYGYAVENDGWALRRMSGYYYGAGATSPAPIYAPYTEHGLYAKWPTGFVYKVSGTWGWEFVPTPVEEAALVLAEQRLCNQASYRDNYMASMKAADWRFDFFQEAIHGTGNVVADQLLEPYRVVGAAVF